MRKTLAVCLTGILIALSASPCLAAISASTRIKDVAKVQGVRANQLVGYGLVVGLAGTGDSNKITYTIDSIVNMLKSFGVNVPVAQLQPKNVAAVMVTAQLPP
jgi:flagellar P-ring protein FlgI